MPLPYRIGSTGPEILKWQQWFRRAYRSYAPLADGIYDDDDVAATRELQRRLGLVQTGIFDVATARKAGFPVPRHLGIVFRGTGGIIGEDYVSRVLQAVSSLVEEINPNFPATMGGIPVGTAGSPQDPSMANAVNIAFEDAKRIFSERHSRNPQVKVVIGGYSAGAVAAARFREWIQANYPENYLCSFSFGDPTRPAGGCYFGGTPTPGRGISSWRYGDVRDWRHCWLAAPGDMYTAVPDGPVGDIMDTAYDMVTQTQISNPLGTAQAILQQIPVILQEAGISVPGVFGALSGGPTAIVGFVLPLLIGAFQGLIGGAIGGHATTPGTAAAAEAALIGLRFIAQQPPTAPHIEYHIREVWPGQTYLGLAIQHVRDWASRVQPT